jgi:exonuclease SbcC
MIKNLQIENFQCWRSAQFPLVEGVNIINGPSNEGKSAILRAFRLALFNEPNGFGYRSTFEKKAPTIVNVEFTEGSWIERLRSDTENHYSCSTHTKLEALRGQVPKEISDITCLEKINFQNQFDAHFLLNESPGAVGRYLNELLSLELIDVSSKNINTIHRQNIKEQKQNEKEIADLEAEIKNLEYIDDLELKINSLEIKDKKLNENQNIKLILTVKVSKLRYLVGAINEIQQKIQLKSKIEKIIELQQNSFRLKCFRAYVSPKQKILKESQKRHLELSRLIELKVKVDLFYKLAKQMEELSAKITILSIIKSKFVLKEKQLSQTEASIHNKRKQFAKETRGACPLCGNQMEMLK